MPPADEKDASYTRVFLDWFLPPACAGCNREPLTGSALCSRCRADIAWSPPGEAIGLAPDLIAGGIAGARYEGAVETWLRRFKYPGKGLFALHPGPAAVVGELVVCALRELARVSPASLEIDAVVPVPSPIARIRERGFHPAGNLARIAATALRRPVAYSALCATGRRSSQTGLTRAERKRNVVGAFRAASGARAGATLLLVDDVVTTGATLESAAAALRHRGVECVLAVCAARARLSPPTPGRATPGG